MSEPSPDDVGPRWWTVRRAQSSKPATYRCPFCDERLHAMSEHMLIAPEGDVEKRRHAHTDCVRSAHEAGDLVTEDEWRPAAEAARPGRPASCVGPRAEKLSVAPPAEPESPPPPSSGHSSPVAIGVRTDAAGGTTTGRSRTTSLRPRALSPPRSRRRRTRARARRETRVRWAFGSNPCFDSFPAIRCSCLQETGRGSERRVSSAGDLALNERRAGGEAGAAPASPPGGASDGGRVRRRGRRRRSRRSRSRGSPCSRAGSRPRGRP